MKQIKLTHILAVAFAAVTMLGFSACNDEPYQPEKEKTAQLEKEFKETTADLKEQVSDLESAIKELENKICPCCLDTQTVANIIHDSLANNYWTIDEVKNYVAGQVGEYVTMTMLQQSLDTLRKAVNKADSALNARIDADTANIGKLTRDYADLVTKVREAKIIGDSALALAVRDSIRIDTLSTFVTNIYNNLAGQVSSLDTRVTEAHDSAFAALHLAVRDSMRIKYLEGALKEDSLAIIQLKDTLKNYVTRPELMDSIRNVYNRALHQDSLIWAYMEDTLGKLDSRLTNIQTIVSILQDKVAKDSVRIDSLCNEVSAVKAKVDANTAKIDKLTNEMLGVKDVLSKMITGIVIQGTYNPVFGYFALPLGWQSNVLVAYYGDVDVVEEFPTQSTSVLVYGEYPLTIKDDSILSLCSKYNPERPVMPAGRFVAKGPNAGKMYFNVNPNTADLTNAKFTLVATNGDESGIKLDTVKPSTEKLTFGYTGPTKAPVAGRSDIGFYEATATLAESDIDAAKIQIDSELKQAVKNFYHQYIENKSARSAASSLSPSSFTGLAQGLYHQFNGFAPRYELKAEWTDNDTTHTIVSGADVAAIAVKPLSYAFLKDRSFRHLPNITPLSEFDFNINVKDIHFNINFDLGHANTHLHLQAINFNFPDSLTAEITIPNVNATPDPVTGDFPDSTYIAKASLENLEDSINNQFQRLIGHWNDSINAAINGQVDSLIQNINRQVNDFAADIEGQLNTEIQAVVNDAKDQVMSKFGGYLDKVNRVIGKVNSLINRVNRVLDNPNKFLQTILVYQGKDGEFHIMSTTKTIPSVFKGTGAITLYPTSYNAEIAAPAYKKFIAVTNVYKNGDLSTSAQNGDPACSAALTAANNDSPDFVTVMDGGRYGVAFVPTPGYTYEIFYAGYDYSGKISQRKYYVTVK